MTTMTVREAKLAAAAKTREVRGCGRWAAATEKNAIWFVSVFTPDLSPDTSCADCGVVHGPQACFRTL